MRQYTPQGSLSENDGAPGFDAVSRDEWLRWAGEFPPEFRTPQPLNASFAIDLLAPLADGKLAFTIDAGHLEFKGVTFSTYCGSTTGPKVGVLIPGLGSTFAVDVSDCPDFLSHPDFIGAIRFPY